MKLKNTVMGALVAMPLMLAGMQAQAIAFTDYHDPNNHVGLSNGQSYSYVHNIVDEGFNSATDTITSAKLSLWLYDDVWSDTLWFWEVDTETFSVKYDGLGSATNGGEIDNGDSPFNFNLAQASLTQLGDGSLGVTIKSTGGDFYFDKSKLEVQANRVPEPATLALFSLGLLGVGFASRRRRV